MAGIKPNKCKYKCLFNLKEILKIKKIHTFREVIYLLIHFTSYLEVRKGLDERKRGGRRYRQALSTPPSYLQANSSTSHHSLPLGTGLVTGSPSWFVAGTRCVPRSQQISPSCLHHLVLAGTKRPRGKEKGAKNREQNKQKQNREGAKEIWWRWAI